MLSFQQIEAVRSGRLDTGFIFSCARRSHFLTVAGKIVDEDAGTTGDGWLTDRGEEQLLAGFLLPGPGSGSNFRGQPQQEYFS
jgi:hypothetical protein